MKHQQSGTPGNPAQDKRTGPGFRAGVAAGALAVAGLAGIVALLIALLRPAADGAATQAQLAELQARALQDGAQVQALRGQLAASDADLAVERAARRTLEDNLAALQAQAGQLRDRLAFYDQLFPAGPAGTLSIRAAEIARVPAGLRYRVLLMRSARPGVAPFVGNLRFVAEGMRDGVEVRVPLAPLQMAPGPDSAAAASTAPMPDAGNAGTPAGGKTDALGSGKTDALGSGKTDALGSGKTDALGSGKTDAPDGASAGAGLSALVPLEVGQYRNSEGILALPLDFTPMEVAVEVIQDGVVQASQQVTVAF